MSPRLKRLWARLWPSLGFLPGLIVAGFAALGIVLVEVDRAIDLGGVGYLFQGDGSAARTVLQVVAGSLISVAALTFSVTIVVLQLASSQFSPRVLRTFFGDRVTQVTIGTFGGVFVYALLVLRAVGSAGGTGFVPRLSITVASVLGVVAVVLLVVFLNHVSRMIQVSAVTAAIAHDTLARADALYPEGYGNPDDEAGGRELLERWRETPPGVVLPSRPGYVQRIELEHLVRRVSGDVDRVAIRVRPGDFVSVETPVAEVWPAGAARQHAKSFRDAVAIESERDLHQDLEFGLRQLADIALRAISPAVNDPMTAVTCIGYMRSILVRVTERALPSPRRRFPGRGVEVLAFERSYEERLDVLLQVNRYVAGDAWVGGELLRALEACAEAARRCGARDRLGTIRAVAETIVEQTLAEVANERDREAVAQLAGRIAGEVGRAG